MKIFLIVVAGVVVGVLILAALALAWIKRKVGSVCEAITQIAMAGGLTPFRIHLENAEEVAWSDAEGVDRATRHLKAVGYMALHDYTIPEMEDVRLRAFWHPQLHCYAVLYDHGQAGVFADVVRDFDDGTHLTVSCAPESGMDRPLHAPLVRLALDVRDNATAQTLHDRLVQESADRAATPNRAEDFEHIFTEAYAQEMDWRIARGGVTEAEIERIAALGGQEKPNACQVEVIRSMWSSAIGSFIEEEVTETWLADSEMSAVDWERLRDRIIVVHDHGDAAERIEELSWLLVEGTVDMEDDEAVDRAHTGAAERLRPVFENRSIREGFAEAQALLPEKRRYERLGGVEDPWPADVYAMAPDDEA